MKFRYIKSILPVATLCLATLGTTSCVGDLDVTPIDPSTVMTADAVGLFNKCYANLAMPGNGGANGDCDIDRLDGGTTGFVRQLFNANELTTDEAICCWGDEGIPAFNYNSWSSSHPMLNGFYNRLYFGISVCNHYLETSSGYDATMTAEVRFLRALYYYHLMDCWGNVPFPLTVSSEAPQQTTRQELYNWLETELLEIEPDMSEPKAKKFGDEGYGRADKAALWMLLSRLYLNAEIYTGTAQWSKAAEYAEKVMNSGYTLFTDGSNGYSAYQMLFMGNNGENGSSCEAILPLLQDGTTTTSWGTSLFLIASTIQADMGNFGTTETWAGNRARQDLVDKFFPNGTAPNATTTDMVTAAKDDRALFYGVDRTLSVETPTEFTSGFSVAKFTNVYSDGGTPHNSQFIDTDFFLMRVAEAYLTYAEATARANGGTVTAEGKNAIDAIRNRAHAATRSTYTLDDILDEWSREFYFEGRRRTDLIRYGYFGGNNSYKWQWKGGVKEGTTFSANLNIFAIPSDDMNANSNLVQNPGY
ncbi:RagB/SusD family nutrient uptake outer membrane protein [uncultured Bacteroides sp.]|uniref:RagB/SusD family nutrient uptake outer membrane protein n=1 Tax=uncultured Bacteroides sp. TaxID=162156 RepID=UPI00261A691C|nr:RagB/SusD family nutrient uptake outer membrane protein [uncultured Bacteroides sp.]